MDLRNRTLRVTALALVTVGVLYVASITTSRHSHPQLAQPVVVQQAAGFDDAAELRLIKSRASRSRPQPSPQAVEKHAVHRRLAVLPRKVVHKRAPVETPTYVASGSVWDRLAQCESGGNWHINTGNGFYGGLQFDLPTWHSNGGHGYPNENTREEQIRVATILRSHRGYHPWPACSRKLGLHWP